jgi:hypothetical protein
MTYVNLYSYLRTYLAVRKAIVAYDNQRLINEKYDKPCCDLEKKIKKGIFLLWCLESIDCYIVENTADKFLSICNRYAKNCGDCSVTQAEIETFMDDDFGKFIMKKSKLGGYLLKQNGSWLLQQNGYKILI